MCSAVLNSLFFHPPNKGLWVYSSVSPGLKGGGGGVVEAVYAWAYIATDPVLREHGKRGCCAPPSPLWGKLQDFIPQAQRCGMFFVVDSSVVCVFQVSGEPLVCVGHSDQSHSHEH